MIIVELVQHLIKMKSCFVITCICCTSVLLLHFCQSPHHISDILGVKGQWGELPNRFRLTRCSSSRAFRNTPPRFSSPFGSGAADVHRARGHSGRAHVKLTETSRTTFLRPVWRGKVRRPRGRHGPIEGAGPVSWIPGSAPPGPQEAEAKVERLGNVK